MVTYFRVFDYQRGTHFAVGYNATSMEELVKDFQDYISNANEVEDVEQSLPTWDAIAEHLQGVELETSTTKFEEDLW
jgi:hypothetical protein